MRDIGRRIQRYELSRYAAPHARFRRRLRWIWVALGAWLLWAGLFSDHSFYQLWRLQRENARATRDLEALKDKIRTLEAEARDPRARREAAERQLREKNGMARPNEIIYRIEGAPDTSKTD
jgi:cell division protein FtsB